jgi:hypothetical protein
MIEIRLLPGIDLWPENAYTDRLRSWLRGKSDDEFTWPTEKICNIAASLAETLPIDFRMVPDGDGGIVFTPPYTSSWGYHPTPDGGRYHIWDDGEVERIDMQNGKVVNRHQVRTIEVDG